MSIIAETGSKWGKPIMETSAGTVPMKAYVTSKIAAYQYKWVSKEDFKNSAWLDKEQMKLVDLGSYTEHPTGEIKVVYYLSVPAHNAVVQTNPMTRSMNEKGSLRKIALAAMGSEGVKITHCEQLVGTEIDVLYEKKTAGSGAVYLKIKDMTAVEGTGWTE